MSEPRVKRPRIRKFLIVFFALLLLLISAYFIFEPSIDRALYPREYSDFVGRYAKQYDVPANLIYAVMRTESGFDPDAVSSAGAVGLMQMMPSTFRWLSDNMLGEHLEDGMLYDPETNIRYGVYYLRRLYDRYGNWQTACAAYNAGNGTVDRWLSDDSLTDTRGKLIPDRIPIGETKAYVKEVKKTYNVYCRLYPTLPSVPFS